jgi:hypothetical protein
LTIPGLGAFAMTTSVRPPFEERAVFSGEDSIGERGANIYAGRGFLALRCRK